ncbi:hypothetical protein VTN77DRAFT_7935 [Rasamsonia byssochlamydoides]|uniref:uncharacterized protein n=1 Tax=Rasamsonia byssochlamydoides TaxID=89139 RepID=UPI0037432035
MQDPWRCGWAARRTLCSRDLVDTRHRRRKPDLKTVVRRNLSPGDLPPPSRLLPPHVVRQLGALISAKLGPESRFLESSEVVLGKCGGSRGTRKAVIPGP